MTRKTPFSGKAKKQQLQEKRDRTRRRREAESSDEEQASKAATTTPSDGSALVTSGRGDLRTVFQAESESAIRARKQDATRVLTYAPNRGTSQSIYAYGFHDSTNQPPILLKPLWSHNMAPEDLVEAEDQAYHVWIQQLEELQRERGLPINLFERNIEVWRQLWRTIERSDVLVHLADARCPVLHLSDQLIQYIRTGFPDKRVLLVLTKADMVTPERTENWRVYLQQRYGCDIPVFVYDKEQAADMNGQLLQLIGEVSQTIDYRTRQLVRHEDDDTLTIGFVGEPNVGKSSLLNSLFDRKLVSVSPTPGHTKHLQTHYFPHPELIPMSDAVTRVVVCDCPGVVFPRLSVPFALQVLFGSYPIAQTREPYSAIRFIAENCVPPLNEVYGLRPVEEDDEEWTPYTLCESYAKLRGFNIRGGKLDVHRAANQLLRDTLNGKKVVLSFPPPEAPESAATSSS